MVDMLKQIKGAVLMFVICVIICGVFYPVIITLIAQQFFPWQANGSLLKREDQYVGSALIGQNFTAAKYFWGRPSATLPFPYNAQASMGSNLAPTNPVLVQKIKERANQIIKMESNGKVEIPVDMVTSSASGLDPDISVRSAIFQVQRIAKARNVSETQLLDLINANVESKILWVFGAERVNVLRLNLALDDLQNTVQGKKSQDNKLDG